MSLTNRLKEIYEKVPKGIKYAFAPVFIRLMVKNKIFVKTWEALDDYDLMTPQQKEEMQFKKLTSLLKYAYSNVPYYKTLFNDYDFDINHIKSINDLERLPLLEKDAAIEAGEQLYSKESNLSYYKSVTGGSSGKALTVLLDKDSIYKERAVITHYLSKFGYDPLHTKTVAFWGHNKDQDYYYSPLKNEIVISPFRLFKDNQIDSICDDIEKFGATYVMGYPSAIFLFAQLLEKSGRKLNFDHVVYYAENCSHEEKVYIEKILECPVDSYYGHTERACFAEVHDSGCIFNDYYGITELLPTESSNEYRIVCTGFLSHKMPLIRYATDDVVQIDSDGRKKIVGHKRSEVYLLSKNDRKIFKGAMTLHVEELNKIRRYQYVQNEKGKAELRIVTDAPMSEQEISNVEKYIARRCEGLIDIEIKFVDELQLTTRGKYNWAVNNIR